ncbi:MAG: LPXTG cell wall anchor domain-containing protein [Streptococcus parauberis]
MKKAILIKLVTVSGILLLGGTPVFASDVADTVIDSSILTDSPTVSDPVGGTTDTNTPLPSTGDPVGGTTDTNTPPPSTSDPVGGTTDTNTPPPGTGDPVGGTTDTGTEKPSTDKPSDNSDQPILSVPSKPVTTPAIDQPITTVTGDQVIATKDGKVLVQTATGTQLKEATEVGGDVQKDGTVSLKIENGDLKVLPHTGDSKKVFTVLGIILILGAIWVGFKDNIKKLLTVFNKKEK